jgi:predicted Rossmann-fold nucleotide-binding protein
MFDSMYWKGFLDWLRDSALSRGLISEEDFDLLRICDHVDEITEAIRKWCGKHEVTGKKAISA